MELATRGVLFFGITYISNYCLLLAVGKVGTY
jgi:hypothetical protein